MSLTIQRETLLRPLKAVAGVVEKRSTQGAPILGHVLIQVENSSITFTTTDQEVELIAKTLLDLPEGDPEKKIIITVPFRKLMDLCRALPEGIELSLVEEQGKIIIRAGKSRFVLSSLSAQDFPNLLPRDSDIQIQLSKKSLSHLLNSTCFAMAEQDVRYYLNGLLLELKQNKLYAVASDGHRLALCYATVDALNVPAESKAGFRIIVPRKGIMELQRLLVEEGEVVKLWLGQQHLRAEMECASLTSRLLEGRFPEYEGIIPKGNKIAIINREILRDACLRATALFSDKFRGIRLQFSHNRVKISASNSQQDELEEEIEVEYAGEDLEIGFNVKYLIDFLTVSATEQVRFTFMDANTSTKVEGVGREENTYVIMPMRI